MIMGSLLPEQAHTVHSSGGNVKLGQGYGIHGLSGLIHIDLEIRIHPGELGLV